MVNLYQLRIRKMSSEALLAECLSLIKDLEKGYVHADEAEKIEIAFNEAANRQEFGEAHKTLKAALDFLPVVTETKK